MLDPVGAVGDVHRQGPGRVEIQQLGAAIEVALMAKEPELRLTALPLSIQLAPKTAIAILVKLLANGTVLEKRAAFKALGTAPQAEADDVLLLQLERLATGHIEPSAQLEFSVPMLNWFMREGTLCGAAPLLLLTLTNKMPPPVLDGAWSRARESDRG